MNSDSLPEWLEQLETLHPTAIELGLERITMVANVLALLPVQVPVVTVAGTNGKGSTVAVLDSLLREAGQSTGVFTSPHLLRFNERIKVDGAEVADAEIVAAFQAIDVARGEISLTYFEFAALAALFVFRARGPDFIVLEVGLGGRLDAVNIVEPTVSVITSIDLDHQDWLGESRGEIAREKAGILRPAVPVVIADEAPPVELEHCIEQVGAKPAFFLGRQFTVDSGQGHWQGTVQQVGGSMRALPLQPSGSLLPQNICAAVQAAVLLGVQFSDEQLANALADAPPAGRRERGSLGGIDCVLDVAHNPAAINKMLEYIDASGCNGKKILIFSILTDKDATAMVKALAGRFDAIFLGEQARNPRAAKAADLGALFAAAGEELISISKNLRQALRRAQSVAKPGDLLVVCGSFYTVAEVLPLLRKSEKKMARKIRS